MTNAVNASRHQPYDIVLNARVAGTEPWKNKIEGHLTGPRNTTMTVPGFYNGGSEWIVRFSPPRLGEWTWRTVSDHEELDSRSGSLTCDREGGFSPLQIDPAYPRHPRHADGTRFFLVGYEADWLFALDLDAATLDKTDLFLDDLRTNGFNQIVMNVYAHDFTYHDAGRDSEYDRGRPPLFPFGGTNDEPDHTRLNPAFFRHLDRVMRLMLEKELVSHLMIYVWNKNVNWPAAQSFGDNLYFDHVIARYQAFPNLIWNISKEALCYGRCTEDYVSERIDQIRKKDGHGRLVTVHEEEYCRRHPDKIDIFSVQDWRTDLYARTRSIRGRIPPMPLYNIEHGGYEKGPLTTFEGDYQEPAVCLERNYQCLFAGAYSTYYWQDTAWNILIYDRSQLPPEQQPHYEYFKFMRAFFDDLPFHELEPMEGWSTSGYLLGKSGSVLLFFKPSGSSRFQLVKPPMDPPDAAVYCAEWFNPLTGERRKAGTHSFDRWRPFRSPWGTQMAVLKLEAST